MLYYLYFLFKFGIHRIPTFLKTDKVKLLVLSSSSNYINVYLPSHLLVVFTKFFVFKTRSLLFTTGNWNETQTCLLLLMFKVGNASCMKTVTIGIAAKCYI